MTRGNQPPCQNLSTDNFFQRLPIVRQRLLQVRKLQQLQGIFRQGRQVVRFAGDAPKQAILLSGAELFTLGLQGRRSPHNHRQRRAQVVRHGRQKSALKLLALGLKVCRLHRRSQLHAPQGLRQ